MDVETFRDFSCGASRKRSLELALALTREVLMTILLVILVLLLIGAIPAWPYSRSWGPYPSGGLGLVLLIVVILMLLRVF